jgi:hypothetical protein
MKYRKDFRSYEEKAGDTAKGWFGLALIFVAIMGIIQGFNWLYEFLVR